MDRPRPSAAARRPYVRPRVVALGSVAGLTLAGSGAASKQGSKPGFRIDGSGCSLVPQGQGNKGCK